MTDTEFRKEALALYKPPFNYYNGYIFDSTGNMFADEGREGDIHAYDYISALEATINSYEDQIETLVTKEVEMEALLHEKNTEVIYQTNRAAKAEQQLVEMERRWKDANALNTEAREELSRKFNYISFDQVYSAWYKTGFDLGGYSWSAFVMKIKDAQECK